MFQRIIEQSFAKTRKFIPRQPLIKSKSIKMLTLSVDGNISSGKSTLVNKLLDFFPKNGTPISSPKKMRLDCDPDMATVPSPQKIDIVGKFQVEVIPEPLEKWCNLNGHNLLEMFYKEPEKNNFLFQHYVQLTRLQDTVGEKPNGAGRAAAGSGTWRPVGAGAAMTDTLKLRIMERSLQNNRHCFLELAQQSGKLHPAEFAVLVEWYNWLEKNMNLNLDLILYLRTKPETAYSRMKARGRAEEDSCPLEYLQNLHQAYENWLIKSPTPSPKIIKNEVTGTKSHVIVLDANKSKEEVSDQCFKLLREYLNSLKNLNDDSDSEVLN